LVGLVKIREPNLMKGGFNLMLERCNLMKGGFNLMLERPNLILDRSNLVLRPFNLIINGFNADSAGQYPGIYYFGSRSGLSGYNGTRAA